MTTQRKTFFLTKEKLFKIETIGILKKRRGQKNFQNKKIEKNKHIP